ncbi:MAG: SDR family NAD(P)-dependent oxidoreductase [Oscillospiraceae bacterium]
MDYNRLLEGKHAFITSGQRGIGREIALLFARQGATVAVGGPREEAVRAAQAELMSIQPASRGYVCNLGKREETENTCATVLKDFGKVDILVNTVGVNRQKPAHEITDQDMEELLEINYKSGLRCARKMLPGMMERKAGAILNISSIHGVVTMPKFALYAGTKGAVNASARAMALDYAPYGIRVNTICPGLIMSDNMVDELNGYPEGEKREAFEAMLRNMQPLPPGTMADVANAALFLASGMAAYITGQVIMVDGGASAKAH